MKLALNAAEAADTRAVHSQLGRRLVGKARGLRKTWSLYAFKLSFTSKGNVLATQWAQTVSDSMEIPL